jgi:outer membrane protein assembly factor BamE (lipoprotein component of BamABCDE complex)
MRLSRFLPYATVLLVVFGLLSGCSRGPSEEEIKQAEFQDKLTLLQQQYDELQQARVEIEATEVAVAEIDAIKERDRTEEQVAQLTEAPTQLEALNLAKDGKFEAVQGTLANFLNVALNEFPEDPGTQQGLSIYADEGILIARETVAQSGDYKKALNQLNASFSYFDRIGLPPYQPLVDEIALIDEMRFITQERYDLVKKNMTKDEVKEVAGVPYYQNIQIDEKRGVETWLYRKRDGGAAGLYFRMKTEKMYNKNFEAVKTKVVE